jgi:hypothetical protein
MVSAQAFPDRQRLEIVSDEPLGAQEAAKLIETIRSEAARLQPGWVAAVDFRGMWVESSFVNERFRDLQEALLALGAARIGTLLDSDPVKMRLWQSGSQTRSNEITQRFYDQAAWEEYLSRPAPG